MKKKLAIFLAFAIVLSSLAPVFAEKESSPYEEAGRILEKAGVLKGSSSGDLMLDKKFKRQDMVILMSRLYGEEAEAKKFPIQKTFKDLNDKFYQPYVSWAVDKNIITGMSATRFGFGENVTVQQYQTVLLRSLGYEKEAKDWHKVPEFAGKVGIMKDLTVANKSEAERGLMAQMTINALRLKTKGSDKTLAEQLKIELPSDLKVESSFTVSKDLLTIKGKIKDVKEMKAILTPVDSSQKSIEKTIKVNPNGDFTVVFDNLVSGEYNYKFKLDKKVSQETKIKIDELPFELVDISANNLREIHLTFTNPVDSSSGLFYDNYTTDAGDIGSARLANNDKTVILTLSAGKTMINQKSYNISAQNIVSKSGQSLTLDNETFTVFDNAPPEVVDVKALGNQRVQITLSEPVKFPAVSSFQIDGKRFAGRVQNNDNIITLVYPIHQKIEAGEHVVSIAGLEDYAGYRGVAVNKAFKVINDTSIPTIKNYYASMEEVVLEFDKEIDENSLNRTNFYWMSGSNKRHPDNIKVNGPKVTMTFSGNNTLPTHEVPFTFEKVKDYFGNTLTKKSITLKATVDTTSPKVLSANPTSDGKAINVVYSKNVRATNRSFYKLTDKNKKTLAIRSIEGSGRNYKINLASTMPEGINKLEISGVKDTTLLENTLIPFTKEFVMSDVEEPKIINHSGSLNEIILMFNKDMDLQTATNPANYLISINNRLTYLPNSTDFEPIGDSKTLLIRLPRQIDGTNVDIGQNGTVKQIQVLGLKANNGVLLTPTTLNFTSSNQGEANIKSATLKEAGIIEAVFDQPITYASVNDFSISGEKIVDVQALGGGVVRIITDSKDKTNIANQLEVKVNNNMSTLLNTKVRPSRMAITDKVAPRIQEVNNLQRSPGTIYLPFTEDLDSSLQSAYKRDLIVEKIGYGKVDFTTTVYKNEIRIYVANESSQDEYTVRLVDRPNIISDLNGNIIEGDGKEYLAR